MEGACCCMTPFSDDDWWSWEPNLWLVGECGLSDFVDSCWERCEAG